MLIPGFLNHKLLFQSLATDGFAIVPSFIAPNEVRALSDAFDRLVCLSRTFQGTTDWQGSRFVIDADPFRIHRVVWCGGAEPAIGRFGDDPRFVEVAAAALGARPVVQIIQQAHFKLPGDEVAFAWHQDASNRRYGTDQFFDVNGRGSFIQTALAIDGTGPENGGLSFVAGSHRLGFVANPVTGALPEGLVDPARIVAPKLHPGDLILFGPFVIHGSEPNRSAQPRRLFLQGYTLSGANHRVYQGCGTGVLRNGS